MRERDIFIEALQKANPAERSAYLDAACAGNPALRQRVEQLLVQHEKNESFLLDSPIERPTENPASDASVPTSETPGAVIGPYKLLEQIGEGGMGTVWMAEQKEPVKRLVALKLVKAGMDSKQVIARFEVERQALALMDHPNIARVLDAGMTGAGRPYFVMELVKGVPITKYCDERQLTPRQRLELFVTVCLAVQHAHNKGIIHRDLKPSNMLVAQYDDKPVAKVIDFGVAKATGQTLTDKTLVTEFGAIVGTLEYMSPEQAQVNQLDIDTRSDIYSLGVILYELLAGSPPFTRRELKEAGILEMLRVIREQEPVKPSTKVSSSEALPTLSVNRGMEPAKLKKQISGELDWIVMKSLEKNRDRRYGTANDFASDVQRYLANEPVAAGPPSAAYRFRKFLQRHRGRVAAAAMLFLSLVVGMVSTSLGLVEARRQRDKAEEQKVIANKERDEAIRQEKIARKSLDTVYAIATAHDPIDQFLPGQFSFGKGSRATAQSLAKARQELTTVLIHPRERAQVDMVLGNVLRSRGAWRESMPMLENAVRLLDQEAGAPTMEKARALYLLGWLQRDVGNLRDSERSLRACLKYLSTQNEPVMAADANFQLGWTQADLAFVAAHEKKPALRAAAATAIKAADRLYREADVPDAPVKSSICQLAIIMIQADYGNLDKIHLLLLLSKLPAGPDLIAMVHASLVGEQARRANNYNDAIPKFMEAEQTARRVFGFGHPVHLVMLASVGETHRKFGKRETGDRLMREVIGLVRRASPNHPRLVELLRELAESIEADKGNLQEALDHVEEAIRIARIHGEDMSHVLPNLRTFRKRLEMSK